MGGRTKKSGLPKKSALVRSVTGVLNYSAISITAPEPTVRRSHLERSKWVPLEIVIFGRNEFALAEILVGRAGSSRPTSNLRRLSRRPIFDGVEGGRTKKSGLPKKSALLRSVTGVLNYSAISITAPEPTVRPPSRIAKRRPFSMAMGVISSTFMSTLSPGMHISVPSGRLMIPVTSVVRK